MTADLATLRALITASLGWSERACSSSIVPSRK